MRHDCLQRVIYDLLLERKRRGKRRQRAVNRKGSSPLIPPYWSHNHLPAPLNPDLHPCSLGQDRPSHYRYSTRYHGKGCSGWHFARDPLRIAKETRHRSPTARNSLHSRMTNLASKHPLKVLMIREAWNCPYTSTTDFECLVELLRRLKPSPQRSLQLNPHPVTADLLRELSTTTVGLETLSTPSRLVALFDNPARVFGLSKRVWSESCYV
jgi:hypothetical protein